MSASTDIKGRAVAHSGLNGLIAGRIYPDQAPQNPTQPFVVYQFIDTAEIHHAMGVNGPIRRKQRYQFAGYADTRLNAEALGEMLIACFDVRGGYGSSVIESFLDGEGGDITEPDQTAQFFRNRLDFFLWI